MDATSSTIVRADATTTPAATAATAMATSGTTNACSKHVSSMMDEGSSMMDDGFADGHSGGESLSLDDERDDNVDPALDSNGGLNDSMMEKTEALSLSLTKNDANSNVNVNSNSNSNNIKGEDDSDMKFCQTPNSLFMNDMHDDSTGSEGFGSGSMDCATAREVTHIDLLPVKRRNDDTSTMIHLSPLRTSPHSWSHRSSNFIHKHDESRDDSSFFPNLLTASFETISDPEYSFTHDRQACQLDSSFFLSPLRSSRIKGVDLQKNFSTPTSHARKKPGPPTDEISHLHPDGIDAFDADISPIPLHPDPSFDDTSRQIGASAVRHQNHQESDSFAGLPSSHSNEPEGDKIREISLLEQDSSMEHKMKDPPGDLSSQMTLESPFQSPGRPQLTDPTISQPKDDKRRPWIKTQNDQHLSMLTPSQLWLSSSLHQSPGVQFGGYSATNASTGMLYPPHPADVSHRDSPIDFSYPFQTQSLFFHQHNHHPYRKEIPYVTTGPKSNTVNQPNFGSYAKHNPRKVLFATKAVFEGCTYRLECIRETNVDRKDDRKDSIEPGSLQVDIDEIHLKKAQSLVHAAICAFGGHIQVIQCVIEKNSTRLESDSNFKKVAQSTMTTESSEDMSNPRQATEGNKKSKLPSIFRQTQRPPSKTESQGITSCPKDKNKSTNGSASYDDVIHERYTVSATRISWEVEEDPPVHTPSDVIQAKARKGKRKELPTRSVNEGANVSHNDTSIGTSVKENANLPKVQQKAKYRCKLCGKPKNNHVCPYEKSSQRTIAIMVSPSINAFTSDEPAGMLTPSLSEMNNFVAYGSRDSHDDNDSGHTEVTLHQQASLLRLKKPVFSRVTPEIRAHGRDAKHHHSPPNAFHPDLTLKLRNEQFRAVTSHQTPSSKQPNPGGNTSGEYVSEASEDCYDYPQIPLTFQGRKILSDTLFFMAKKVPSFTTEVALLLRTARENDEWDQAVAELMTQLVVGLFCTEGDHELNGLRDYLRSIGICA